MTTLMIAVAAMTVGAAVGFLTARLICGTASSVQRSPYMSSRVGYRQRAADAEQRAAQAKDLSIKIAFEYEAAFWRALAEQLDWIGRKEVSPSNQVQRVTPPPGGVPDSHKMLQKTARVSLHALRAIFTVSV